MVGWIWIATGDHGPRRRDRAFCRGARPEAVPAARAVAAPGWPPARAHEPQGPRWRALVVPLPLLVILVVNLGRDPHVDRSPLIGRPAPAFSLARWAGARRSRLASLTRQARGRRTSGRPGASRASRSTRCWQEAARRLGARAQFLGIVYEDEEAHGRCDFLRQKGSAYPSLMDEGGQGGHRLRRVRRARDLLHRRRGDGSWRSSSDPSTPPS